MFATLFLLGTNRPPTEASQSELQPYTIGQNRVGQNAWVIDICLLVCIPAG